ncbi:MAG: methyltransferase domain-containing protein [Idiomarina sp.]|nr:methyltransferase domain-containing protein [Idiomarina sp.]
MTDRIFANDSARFHSNIYETAKGRIREAVLQRDLAVLRDGQALSILDAGAGLGQVNQWFAERGHRVLHLDASEEMVCEAQKRHVAAGLNESYQYRVGSIQSLASDSTQYDLVLCHAVLEWLTDPAQALELLTNKVKVGGWFSLMFYNRAAKVMANMVYGNHDYVASGLLVKKKVRFSPQSPLEISEVEQWCERAGLTLFTHSGVRCFHDYLKEPSRVNEQQLLELELQYSRQEPYRPLGRYQHFLLRKI